MLFYFLKGRHWEKDPVQEIISYEINVFYNHPVYVNATQNFRMYASWPFTPNKFLIFTSETKATGIWEMSTCSFEWHSNFLDPPKGKGWNANYIVFWKVLFCALWLITFEARALRNKNRSFCRSQRDAHTHKISCRSAVIKAVKNFKNQSSPHFELIKCDKISKNNASREPLCMKFCTLIG